MRTDHFTHIKMALEIEEQSPHPEHKVGALLHGNDTRKQPFLVAKSNFWPPLLEDAIGYDKKLGNASTSVHAEIATILDAPATEDASIYITKLPCPNCAKAIAGARIKNIYIDSGTHNTELGQRTKPYFDEVSLLILKSAEINVFEVDIEKNKIHTLYTANQNTALSIEHPIQMQPVDINQIDTEKFDQLISKQDPKSPFAACFARTPLGKYHFISAKPHRSPGLREEDAQHIREIQNKYMATLQPLNRLLLTCARFGLKIDENYLYSSQTPTSREFVNMIGAGYEHLSIGDTTISRDQYGLTAIKQIRDLDIIKTSPS